jgi:ATP-binding cassette subfamily B (MDR/TAP) protein 1
MELFVCAEVSCWTITGERQAARIRSLYLKSILRQDIAFFDIEMTTGQIVSRMSGDTVLVQDAIGEKVRAFSTSSEKHISKKIIHCFLN